MYLDPFKCHYVNVVIIYYIKKYIGAATCRSPRNQIVSAYNVSPITHDSSLVSL